MSNLVAYKRNDAVSTIVINDGKANLMSTAMLGELHAALEQARSDGTVVVITGRAGMFSAGFDLAVFKQGRGPLVEMLTAGARMTETLLSFPAPVVVACSGHAVAMGLFVLLSADVRVGCAGEPYKLCANEVEIGLTVPRFAVETCRQRLAPAHFSRALLTAAPYSHDQGVAAGFLDLLVPKADLMATATAEAQRLAKLDRKSHTATKLRARAGTLEALRLATLADIDDWNQRLG